MEKSGIYKILNTLNGKFYFGSTVYLTRRFTEHKRQLRRGNHPNRFLQRAWNKYGENPFDFSVLEFVSNLRSLLEKEQFWLDETRCFERSIGYNLSPKANSILGYQFSDEQKAKVSLGLKGKKKSAEHRANLWKNREKSPEFLAQMSANGKKAKGRKQTAEHRAKRTLAQIGEKNHQAKLTVEKVIEIKQRLRNGELGKNLAIEFNVAHSAISRIKNGTRWANIIVS